MSNDLPIINQEPVEQVQEPVEQVQEPVQQETTIDFHEDAPAFIKDWVCVKTDDRFYHSSEDAFKRRTIESLYIIAAPTSKPASGEDAIKQKKLIKMINELSFELLGGVPEKFVSFS